MKINRTLELVLVSLAVVLVGYVSVPRFMENQKMAKYLLAKNTGELILELAQSHPKDLYQLESQNHLELDNFIVYVYRPSTSLLNEYLPKNHIEGHSDIKYQLFVAYEHKNDPWEVYKEKYYKPSIWLHEKHKDRFKILDSIKEIKWKPDYVAVKAIMPTDFVYTGASGNPDNLIPLIQKDNQGNVYGLYPDIQNHLPNYDVSNGVDSAGVVFIDDNNEDD